MTHGEDWDMWLALRRTLGYRFAYLNELTCVYHQVPRSRGALSSAYLTSPTPFTLARAHLFTKWRTASPLVDDYRTWFQQFDHRLDIRISRAEQVPAYAYERAVRSLHPSFAAGDPADVALLDTLFPPALDQAGADLPRPRREATHAHR